MPLNPKDFIEVNLWRRPVHKDREIELAVEHKTRIYLTCFESITKGDFIPSVWSAGYLNAYTWKALKWTEDQLKAQGYSLSGTCLYSPSTSEFKALPERNPHVTKPILNQQQGLF